ncbi:MAG: L-2-hydroxyglutarate oxidase [Bacteroidota bacterium]
MGKKIGVIGGGIVGLAIAYKLQLKYPASKILLFEKENTIGQHQSGRNSGVLHCGLYYEPGSLKAKLAVDGIRQMTEFCQENNIPHEICGKIVVASNLRETQFLKNLHERGTANGLNGLKYLLPAELKAREPFVKAEEALLVPEEGIVDYKAVMDKLQELILSNDGEVFTNVEISDITETADELVLHGAGREWKVDQLVSCAGLHSDRVFEKLTKKKRPLRIVPFRGEYLMLKPEAEKLVNHLIYPVPDPEYPFLGIHFTRMMTGAREVGPNAVFALKREGYTNKDFSLSDTFDALAYKGFINFLAKNFTFSMGEFYSSINTSAFLKKARKLIPDIDSSHFVKGTAGVRAQAMDSTGKLIMDFKVVKENRQVHVLNAPSPGATASLAIADHIIENYISESK